jgi:hypothetical protein
MRVRAAIAAVAAYALCVLAPHAALALGASSAAMHCLTEVSNLGHVHQAEAHEHTHGQHATSSAVTSPHADDSGAMHHNSDHGTASANCCGLFCITALDLDGVAALPAPPPVVFAQTAPEAERPSRGPDRIYEPPIG